MAQNGAVIPGRYIVVMNESAIGPTAASDAVRDILASLATNKAADVSDALLYDATITGFAADMDAADAAASLAADARVAYVEPDRIMTLAKPTKPGGGGGSTPSQSTPYGIARVNEGAARTSAPASAPA